MYWNWKAASVSHNCLSASSSSWCKCGVKYVKKGCYSDPGPGNSNKERPLTELIVNHRHKLKNMEVWTTKWNDFLRNLTCTWVQLIRCTIEISYLTGAYVWTISMTSDFKGDPRRGIQSPKSGTRGLRRGIKNPGGGVRNLVSGLQDVVHPRRGMQNPGSI